jgi:hypothetical protein
MKQSHWRRNEPHRIACSRSVSHRARVRHPAHRQQLRQQVCDLAKRRQRRIPRRHIGQFGRYGRGLEVEGGEALCFAPILAGTGQQALNPNWNVTEQRAECRGAISLAGHPTPASRTGAAMLTGDRHLCRPLPYLTRTNTRPRLQTADLRPAIIASGAPYGAVPPSRRLGSTHRACCAASRQRQQSPDCEKRDPAPAFMKHRIAGFRR